MINETTEMACEETRLILQAEIDGELDAASCARLAAHVAECVGCAETRERLGALSTILRRDMTYYAAPASLRTAIERHIASSRPVPRLAPSAASRLAELRQRWWAAVALGGGGALAAAVLLLLVLPPPGDLAENMVSDHIRALQPGHLMDVASSDQHTVKPWFDGRVDFAPPVRDWAPQGFPLAGGRLDYIDGHQAAALVYYHAKHIINVFVWPDRSGKTVPPVSGERDGYRFLHWVQSGMNFWAVSDLEAGRLAEFVQLWRTTS